MTGEGKRLLPLEHTVGTIAGVGRMAVEQRPTPPNLPGRVVVEVSHCGVCGTDLHMVMDGWGQPGRVGGHEYSGVIVDVGDDVAGWSLGDRIVCGPEPSCGACDACRRGEPTQCGQRSTIGGDNPFDGGFAQFVSTDARSLRRVPDGLSLRVAALAEPLAIALHAINRSGVRARGTAVLIMGAGPIGALILAVLVAEGRTDITVCEPGLTRANLARELGATDVVHPSELTTFSNAHPDQINPESVGVVFECSGKRVAMEASLSQLDRGGTLVLVGSGIEPPSFDPNRIILCELNICGAFNYDVDGFERALEWLESGQLPVALLIEPDDVPLDQLTDAMAQLVAGIRGGKVMAVPLSTVAQANGSKAP